MAVAKKEKNEVVVDKERIQQKTFDDVYNAYEAGFNHCLWQVMHLCEVSDPSVFDINKDVYNGGLMMINNILEDAAPMPKRLMTSTKDLHTKGVGVKDEDHVRPIGIEFFRFTSTTFLCISFVIIVVIFQLNINGISL